MFRALLSEPFLHGRAAVGLLLLRLGAGAGMAMHGWAKITGPGGWTGWMGDAVPAWLQGVAASIEFGGGLALLLGLLSPLVGILLGAQMIAAYAMVHGPAGDPFVGQDGSYESAVLYFCIAMLILLAGPGTYSLDRALFGGTVVNRPPVQRPLAD